MRQALDEPKMSSVPVLLADLRACLTDRVRVRKEPSTTTMTRLDNDKRLLSVKRPLNPCRRMKYARTRNTTPNHANKMAYAAAAAAAATGAAFVCKKSFLACARKESTLQDDHQALLLRMYATTTPHHPEQHTHTRTQQLL